MDKQQVRIALKRVYDEPELGDGTRVLVERLWPRGLSKERAHIDLWLKEIAPSRELRTWFGHDPAKFAEFRRRYEAELADAAGQAALTKLRDLARQGPVTLVFAARDTQHSNAAVLCDLLLPLCVHEGPPLLWTHRGGDAGSACLGVQDSWRRPRCPHCNPGRARAASRSRPRASG